MKRYIERFSRFLSSRQYSSGYRKAVLRGVKRFEEFLERTHKPTDPGLWKEELLKEYYQTILKYRFRRRDNREHRLGNGALQERLSSVKIFTEWLNENEEIYSNPFQHYSVGHRRVSSIGFEITEAHVKALLAAPNRDCPIGMRAYCVMSLLYGTGIRRMELMMLDVHDIDLGDHTLTVRCGKNAKGRLVPLGNNLISILHNYLTTTRRSFLKGSGKIHDALFLNTEGVRLSHDMVGNIVNRFAALAGGPRITPHMLRHAFALHMLRRGCDIRYIQEILGHEKLATTTIYTRIYDKDLTEKILTNHPVDRWKINDGKNICSNV